MYMYTFVDFCMTVVFSLLSAVLSFDNEVSKTISLEQYKSVACNDATKSECKHVIEKRDVRNVAAPPDAKVSGPRFSISTPRQSKTSGITPRSARCSAVRGIRGTYVRSKCGFSKYGRHPSQSPATSPSKRPANQPSSSVSNEVADSEPSALETSPRIDAPVANSCRRMAADGAASFSRLFTGSFMSDF